MQTQIALSDTKQWIENYDHRDLDCIHLMENLT